MQRSWQKRIFCGFMVAEAGVGVGGVAVAVVCLLCLL